MKKQKSYGSSTPIETCHHPTDLTFNPPPPPSISRPARQRGFFVPKSCRGDMKTGIGAGNVGRRDDMKKFFTLMIQTSLFCIVLLLVIPFFSYVDAGENKNTGREEYFKNKKCCINIDDISKTISALSTAGVLPGKGEFETSAMYNEKVKFFKEKEHEIINKYYLFKIVQDAMWSKYNADNNNLEFGIKDSANCSPSMHNQQNENIVFVIDIEKEKSDREYVGENSFGVKRTVTEHTRSTKSIYLSNFSLLRKSVRIGEFGHVYLNIFSKTYNAEDAKDIKKRIEMFVLVRPDNIERGDMVCPVSVYGKKKQCYIWEYSYSTKPTIDLPIADTGRYYQLNASLAAVVSVDRETNEIINCTFYDKHQPSISRHFLTN